MAIHFTSERGQPLYNGQNDSSQCVHYNRGSTVHVCLRKETSALSSSCWTTGDGSVVGTNSTLPFPHYTHTHALLLLLQNHAQALIFNCRGLFQGAPFVNFLNPLKHVCRPNFALSRSESRITHVHYNKCKHACLYFKQASVHCRVHYPTCANTAPL